MGKSSKSTFFKKAHFFFPQKPTLTTSLIKSVWKVLWSLLDLYFGEPKNPNAIKKITSEYKLI